MFRVDHNIDRVMRELDDIGKRQVPFALSQALNDTATAAGVAVTAAINADLDRPTRFTQNAVYVRRGSKSRLAAEMGLKPIQAEYLRFVIHGGERRPRGRAIPVPFGLRTNQYGNMPKSAIARLLGRADTFVASSANARTRHLPPGIYQRASGRGKVAPPPKLLVAFEPKAEYGKTLDFYGVARREIANVFLQNFDRRLAAAMQSAR
jgi:hypothetical protein